MAKIGIIYWSGTGNTERIAELIGKGAMEAGAEVICKRVDMVSPQEPAEYDAVVLGSPAMGAESVEESEMAPFVASATPSLRGRKVALFGSYGWGEGEWMREWAVEMRASGAELLDDGLIIKEAPEGEKGRLCQEYGSKIASSCL